MRALRSLCFYVLLPVLLGSGIAAFAWWRSQQPAEPVLEKIDAEMLLSHPSVSQITKERVVLVEFGDLQCPACAMLHPYVQELVQKQKLGYVFRNYPLESIHSFARPLAIRTLTLPADARMAAMVKTWNRPLPMKEDLEKEIEHLPKATLNAAKAQLERDVSIGNSLHLHATPTFFLIFDGKEVWRLANLSQAEDLLAKH